MIHLCLSKLVHCVSLMRHISSEGSLKNSISQCSLETWGTEYMMRLIMAHDAVPGVSKTLR